MSFFPQPGFMKYLSSVVIMTLVVASSLFSQDRFRVAVLAGVNFSQVDGDRFQGFDKSGFNGGIRGSTIFSERFHLDFEMLFSQRGAKSKNFTGIGRTYHHFDVRFNYAEIPILLTVKWNKTVADKKKKTREHFHRYAFNFGASVGRMIKISVEERLDLRFTDEVLRKEFTSWEVIEDEIQKKDVSVMLGFTFYLTKEFGLMFRSSTSVIPLYDPLKNPTGYGNLQRNYFLTAMGIYQF